ncbi:MAG: multiheme c-type cytochrome [Myxococcota bacterium]
MTRMRYVGVMLLALGCTSGGGGAADAGRTSLSVEELMDPVTCAGCHAEHYREWSGSMHAYAARDPVFLAMNRRGQEATNGALGDFCIRCHAPLAVALGATTDGLNAAELPEHLQGVTCFYCHSVVGVEGTHNNPLRLSMDGIMRGGFRNPVANPAHRAEYSALHARDSVESATLCGSCHDIVTPRNVELERTFKEWQHSIYSRPPSEGGLTCNACHMDGRNAPAATGGPTRRTHSHAWPGVDVALTEFPNREEQRAQVQRMLDSTLLSELCVYREGGVVDIQVTLENIAAGHAFPSGAAQDRRVWVEVKAYRGEELAYSSGVLPPHGDITRSGDENLWLMRDWLYDEADAPTHLFWEAARYDSVLMPAPTALLPSDPGWTQTHRTRAYVYAGEQPDRVELAVHVQPMGADVLAELVSTGYLERAVMAEMPVFTLAAASLTWRAEEGLQCVGATPRRP